MTKGSISQEDIKTTNIYSPNISTAKYMKQILTELKRETDNSTIVGHFNTLFSIMYRTTRQKINKETEDLSNTYIPSKPTRKYTHSYQEHRNILQGRPYVRPQNKPLQILKH